MNQVDINYLAVAASGVLSLVVGGLWYGPLFGKVWAKEIGKTDEELKKDFNPAKTFSLTAIAHMFVALIVSYFLDLFGADSMVDALRIALTTWTGFIIAPMIILHLFEKGSKKLLIINSAYFLVILILFSIILFAWS